ncbi:UDP-N-acetylmuramoyl-L-alanyl-D-glutamate--2,6-diaminopimelate ligase [Desulfogranum mediterraneum]|uniref:UDP-N-acetylmuramoyl-L-alanyl-D-glutamate--2, 6-diaminopimelate ligase n=1 Tax=Desulfogranum mediterraneum TaxID=160661 RepID=UPI000416CCBF|nr:UDP-N-acetylmuramoyl-L-alanyl-D-glutamate--2,6-diaminopimelate ligase [Desulfogranum mediterraneum]
MHHDLETILAGVANPQLSREETGASTAVSHLTCSSSEVGPGTLFVALEGSRLDGHDFIDQAFARGAVAVVARRGTIHSRNGGGPRELIIEVDDPRSALAEMAAAWYDHPAEGLVTIGITGTNGKTTCTWLLEQLLVQAGHTPGVIGTINYRYRHNHETRVICEAPLTTPDPLTLQRLIREMADQGVSHLIMEVSSHALDQHRLGSLCFDVCAFTNLSRDHLDYHQSFAAYFQAKQRLFQEHLKPTGTAVVVTEDCGGSENWGQRLYSALEGCSRLCCGFGPGHEIRAAELVQDAAGSRCRLRVGGEEGRLQAPLIGRFNLLNILVATGVGHALGLDLATMITALGGLEQVPGRMERVVLNPLQAERQPVILVDYAHTPDALENVLKTVRELGPKRLICVFGCGGDRDRGKRAQMGAVAGRYADLSVVTSDNPRGEAPGQIIADILPGLAESGSSRQQSITAALGRDTPERTFVVIEDRRAAIVQSCALAEQGDWIVIAGKGHEQYQLAAGEKLFFDDRLEALNGLVAWTPAELAAATGGELLAAAEAQVFAGISTDSRRIGEGDVFVALRGEQFDGHRYLDAACSRGAAALIVEREPLKLPPGVLVIRVEDTLRALGDLAGYRRQKLGARLQVVAITGSSGKTTVKEMTASIFAAQENEGTGPMDPILKTGGNFNNLIGLPLSLLPVQPSHTTAILEMGMNSFGEIARLTAIAEPDIGCITNVQPAHLQGLGSVAGVARAKGELFAGMGAEKVKVINCDDPHLRRLSRRVGGRQLGFAVTPAGRKLRPGVKVTRVVNLGAAGSRFTLELEGWKARLQLRVPGLHNVSNGAAAAAIALAAGVAPEAIVAGLERYQAFDKRMAAQILPGGVQVVNDTYNANPASMEAALRAVAAFGEGCSRVAALGDMLELGEAAGPAHEELGRLVAELGYTMLAVTGAQAEQVAAGARAAGMAAKDIHCFSTPTDIAGWLYQLVTNGVISQRDWILAKGSRGMRMETMIEALEGYLTPELDL